MKEIIERGATGIITHVFIPDSASTTGGGKTGLTYNSGGLKICVIRPGEPEPTKYLQSAGNIEDIATLGTFSAPSSGKCRFKEIDATDMPGMYEIQFANALFNATNSRRSLVGMISGAGGVPTPFQIQLSDPVRGVGSPTALPNAAADAAGGLPISDAGGLDMDSLADVATPIILPATGTPLPRVDGTTIFAYTGSTAPITVYGVVDYLGNPIDLTAIAARKIVIKRSNGTQLQVVAHVSITISGADNNDFTFTPIAAVTAEATTTNNTIDWSLLDVNGGKNPLIAGKLRIIYVAQEDV